MLRGKLTALSWRFVSNIEPLTKLEKKKLWGRLTERKFRRRKKFITEEIRAEIVDLVGVVQVTGVKEQSWTKVLPEGLRVRSRSRRCFQPRRIPQLGVGEAEKDQFEKLARLRISVEANWGGRTNAPEGWRNRPIIDEHFLRKGTSKFSTLLHLSYLTRAELLLVHRMHCNRELNTLPLNDAVRKQKKIF